jgi:hypothetical protein
MGNKFCLRVLRVSPPTPMVDANHISAFIGLYSVFIG